MSKLLVYSLLSALFGFGTGWWVLGARSAKAPVSPASELAAEVVSRASATSVWKDELGAPPRFVDVTGPSQIDLVHENGATGTCQYPEIMGAGVALFDYDEDGDLDVYLVNGNKLFGDASTEITNRLYRNDGDLRFVDVSEEAGVADSGYGQGAAVGDYDRDGHLDLYVSNFGPNRLFRNRGDGTFEDVSIASGVADPGWGQTCVFFDQDGDGWLDLWVQNYLTYPHELLKPVIAVAGTERSVDYPSPLGFRGAADRFYRNRRDGTFLDVTKEAGALRPDGKGMGIGCADFDDDGHVDVFVANDSADNFLFFGRSGGRFEEGGLAAGVAYNREGIPEASMGVDVGDFDLDGKLDLIVPCLNRQVFSLYRNLGEGLFDDVSIESGLAEATVRETGFNANFLDYDADGDLDIFFTCGGVRRNSGVAARASYVERYGMRDILVANDGKGRFVDVSAHAGPYFEERNIGRGSAIGDLDGDGDLDLVVCQLGDRVRVLRNDTAGGHSVLVSLESADGVLQPFGADVRVEVGGRTQRKPLLSGVSYLSQSDRRLHFGLGSARRVDRITIRWPSGRTDRHEGLDADREWRIREGAEPRVVERGARR